MLGDASAVDDIRMVAHQLATGERQTLKSQILQGINEPYEISQSMFSKCNTFTGYRQVTAPQLTVGTVLYDLYGIFQAMNNLTLLV